MAGKIENIGLMIRNERLRKGLTQEDLGERIGVGKSQISKIESGKGLTIKTVTKVWLLILLQPSMNLPRLTIFLSAKRTIILYDLKVLIF